jgi:hypothetical protein
VAVSGSLVAVSAWKDMEEGDHVVHLFEGSGAAWTPLRVLAGGFERPGWSNGQLSVPFGLRFSADGTVLAVADAGNDRVSLFRVEDGSFVQHLAEGLEGPRDVEEWEGVGWLVACAGSNTVELMGGGGGVAAGEGAIKLGGGGEGFAKPAALALVPGLGMLVREHGSGGRVQVFTTPALAAAT